MLLWSLGDPDRLAPSVRDAIADSTNDVFVSAVSGWEIGIKVSIGKLRVPADLADQIQAARLLLLPVTFEDGMALRTLPRYHDDPFDRLLIVQAASRQLTLVTADRRVAGYSVHWLDAEHGGSPGSS